MKQIISIWLVFLFSALLCACTTGRHGSFVEKTYIDEAKYANFKLLGPVVGESCQTRTLYVFPKSDPPSTAKALRAAKNQYISTAFLADVSIETYIRWYFLYSQECTVVTGIAYSAEVRGE